MIYGCLPTLPEQAAIVRFLDHADRRIRRYIRAQQQLIVLLKEQKQATIHQAVTSGMDSDVPLKPSGVEWFGDVPEHWEVRRLKYSVTLLMGQSPSSNDCSDERIGPPFLQGCAEFGAHHPNPVQFCRAPSRISPMGAILMSVRAPVGKLNTADQEYGIGRGLCAITSNERISHTGFSHYQLETLGHGLKLVSTGSTYDAVSVGDIGNQSLVLPPLPEQAAIVRYLDKATADIDTAVDRARRQIELLREYRTRLIADVVTGKLDVRAAARLPDEVEELEPLDEADALIDGEEEPSDDLDAVPEEAEV